MDQLLISPPRHRPYVAVQYKNIRFNDKIDCSAQAREVDIIVSLLSDCV